MPIGAAGLPWGRLAFLGSVAVAMILAGVFYASTDRTRSQLNLLMPFLLWVGTGMTAIAHHQSFVDPAVLLVSGCILMGFGYAWLALAWYRILSRRGRSRTAAIVFTGSGLLRLLVPVTALARIPEAGIVVLAMLLPLLSAIALAFSGLSATGPAPHPARAIATNRTPAYQLLALCVGLIVLRASGAGGLWGSGSLTGGAAVLLFLGVSTGAAVIYLTLAMLTVIRTSGRPSDAPHRVPMLIAIGGFLLLTAVDAQYPGSPGDMVIALANESYYQLIFATVLVSTAAAAREKATRVIGWSLGLTYVLAIVWMLTLGGVESLPRTIVLVVAYALIIVTALYPSRTLRFSGGDAADGRTIDGEWVNAGGSNGRQTSDGDLTEQSIDERCAAIAERHGLTAREQDVFCLLARGRNLPFIQQELHLAEGTVRTHVNHIYQKLDIHSRQELISLLAEEGRR